MPQPADYEHHFITTDYPASFDELLGDRQLCIAFNYQPRCDVDMEPEGYWYSVLAKAEGDAQWEDVDHLLTPEENDWVLKACEEHLKQCLEEII